MQSQKAKYVGGNRMVKIISLLKRKKGITMEEFSYYWYEKHGPLALAIVPETVMWKTYVQNHAVRLPGGGQPQYDAVAEVTFDDFESFEKWNNWYFSDEGKKLRDDEENFMDVSKRVIIITDERVVRGRRIPDPEV